MDRGYNPSYTQDVKTAISIPDDLYRTAERVAKRLGMSRSELYRRALGAFLQELNDKIVTEALDEIYEAQSESRVDPALLRLQVSSLPEEDWS